MKSFLRKLWRLIESFFKEKDKFDYGSLDWCYGGANGAGAVEDVSQEGYTLHSASVNERGIRFQGSGSMWGYSHDRTDARNCLFFEEGGTFHGGFWEWGSVDRTYRGFDNIYSGYKGWNAQSRKNS